MKRQSSKPNNPSSSAAGESIFLFPFRRRAPTATESWSNNRCRRRREGERREEDSLTFFLLFPPSPFSCESFAQVKRVAGCGRGCSQRKERGNERNGRRKEEEERKEERSSPAVFLFFHHFSPFLPPPGKFFCLLLSSLPPFGWDFFPTPKRKEREEIMEERDGRANCSRREIEREEEEEEKVYFFPSSSPLIAGE